MSVARTLDIYLEDELVGHLSQDDGGQIVFDYALSWRDKPSAFPISCSLPLRAERFTQRECKGFFGGILPEDGNRKLVARILKISANNDFAMLEQIGGECAGALTFLPEGEPPPTRSETYRELTEEALAEILRILPKRPLLAGEKGVRLSLAGAQDKLAVRVDANGRISLPLDYAPSTHILKPAIDTWEGIVSNEAFCMQLAQASGLAAAVTSAHEVQDLQYLLSARYDRNVTAKGSVHRRHQEDLCQALGVPSEIKYQAEGGPGLHDCFDLLRRASSNPVQDLLAFLDAVVFNLLIGNNDAHAKNYALLYGEDGSRRLAPLYDIVCTVLYPEIDNTLAMKIGGQSNPDRIFASEIEAFAKRVGLASAAVKRRTTELAEKVRSTAAQADKPDATAEQIAAIVTERCNSYLLRISGR